MKTDFLKSLGIEDKETINAIMAENGKDIANVQGDTNDLKNKIKDLENQLSTKTNDYESLKESTKDYDELTSKVKQLELDNSKLVTDKKQLEIDLYSKVSQILKTHAIENGVRDAKAKNVKAVMALLDTEKITYKDDKLEGLSEQLETLVKGEDTSFLFGSDASTHIAGATPNNPPATGGNNPPTTNNLASAIAKALTPNN